MTFFNRDRRTNRDRRSAPRSPASGTVTVWFENPTRTMIEAEWIESSATGFRLAHDCDALEPGLAVIYEGGDKRGHARVVWTHVCAGGRRVSGFITL